MRRPVFLIFVNAMILIVVFALLTQSLFVTQRLAQARAVAGRVEVQSGGKGAFRLLAANDVVRSGDIVRSAGDGTAEFTWPGGTRWKVMPGTTIKIKKATRSQKSELSQMLLDEGKVFVRIAGEPAPGSRFEIQTPNSTASLRNTICSIEVRAGQAQVRVWKGAVSLAGRNGQKAIIHGGQQGSAGESAIEMRPDAHANDFAAQPSIVRPQLEAQVRDLGSGQALVWGATEAGNALSVNGQAVLVQSNGGFSLSLSAPRDGRFLVSVGDQHGATTMWQGRLPARSARPGSANPILH